MKPSAKLCRKASLALGFFWGAAVAVAQPIASPKAASISIFSINDFHGHIQPGAPVPQLIRALQEGQPPRRAGGYAYLDALLTQLRAASPASILVGAGDMIGATPADSSLLNDEPAIEALNRLGLSVSSLGNHEFDKGPAEFDALIKGRCGSNAAKPCALAGFRGARFDYIAANVKRGETHFAAPFVLREVGGYRIAFVGAVTEQTPNFLRPVFTQGLMFEGEVKAITHVLPQVRALKPDAIVVLMHEGAIVPAVTPIVGPAPAPREADCATLAGRAVEIARALPADVQAFITAHTHQTYACALPDPASNTKRWLVQGGAHGAHVSELRMAPNAQGQLVPVSAQLHATLHESLTPTPAGLAFVAEVQGRTQSIKAQVLGTLNAPVRRILNPDSGDSPAGRFLADGQLAFARSIGPADLAFMNATGIRAALGEGAATSAPIQVTRADLMAMQPLGNEVMLLSMTGAEIMNVLRQQTDAKDISRVRYLQPSSNFSYTWKSSAERDAKPQDVRLDGMPLELDRVYRVAMNSFLAEGGEQFSAFKAVKQRSPVGMDLEASIFFLQRGVVDVSALQQGVVRIEP